MSNVRLLLILLTFLVPGTFAAGQTERLTLTIGESIDVTLAGDDVTVSRKGVVDLFHREGARWTLTGLKRGFVLIKSASTHYKITVVDHETGTEQAPHDLCSTPQATCQADKVVIRGSLESARQYYSLLARCRDLPGCLFQATLSENAAAEVKKMIGKDPVSGGQVTTIQTYCPTDSDPYERFPEWIRSSLYISCQPVEYRVNAHFISLTDSDLSQLGITYSTKFLDADRLSQINLKQIVDAKLVAQRQLVAMPTIQILAGEQATIDAGGEFFVAGSNPEHTSSWKKFGMQLSFKVEPLQDDVRLRYRIQMTGRGDSTSLTGNLTESAISLPPGEQRLVAQVPFYATQREQSGSALLADVPLIGPFFRSTATLADTRQLFVFFTVQELGPNK